LQALAHAGRNVDRQGNMLALAALAPALVARCVVDFAASVTTRAGRHLHHRPEECLLHLSDFAGAGALDAFDRRGTRFRAAAATDFADFQTLELDFLGRPEDRLLERDRHVDAAVGASPWPASAAAAG